MNQRLNRPEKVEEPETAKGRNIPGLFQSQRRRLRASFNERLPHLQVAIYSVYP
jgi:hypothetical protein